MRVAVVSESFLPTVNGVTTSVCRVLDQLAAAGHEAMVISPAAPKVPSHYAGFPVHTVPAMAYRQFPVGLPNPQVARMLADFRPDVVHAASPFLLGAQAIAAANRLGVASVAVYQTDVAGYARRNRMGLAQGAAWRLIKWVHDGATLTLAPSTSSLADLEAAGVERLARWGRGVDLERYHPNNRVSPLARRYRDFLSPNGEVVVGYVGRIAPEKQVERLRCLRGIPGMRLAIVGDGPAMPSVQRSLRPLSVTYLGRLSGDELAAAYSALDVFVHTGEEETFGQTVQEAHASGLPVVAPAAGGPLDLVEYGADGYLFRDDYELRNQVRALVGDGSLRLRMGEAGRRAVLDRSWAAICEELFAHYEASIAEVRAAHRARVSA
ncbi:glycosyltransferase family 4 protein [Gryllotalpicola protaetiae]|uniref:D-inositol 3-phosphate glycosyltransferase n=1 Tax=Gryllotalpicola protaetiae TaxID=2419771 RepID=A0A387BP38_9MICO|nr:glycosyltransferase family 1 protein [Gryllotalpicola protaetiae]AYG04242.1 glycosyltransferase family 1 protein [Gryllotalpicola protaetiae]